MGVFGGKGKHMSRLVALAVAFALSAPLAARAGVPVLSASPEPFSFAVLGDIHYARPAFAERRIAAEIAASVRDVRPAVAFVCQTGDLILGEDPSHKQLAAAGVTEELAFAVTNLTGAFGLPLFVAVGNHDKNAGGSPYRETVLPALARGRGAPLERSYFAFRFGSACLIFLDYGDYKESGTSMDYAAQGRFLEETLAEAKSDPAVRHIFAFGHYPLWPVVRPGFKNSKFTDSVVAAFQKYPVDAYFCGHTHNSGAWVREVGGVPVTQIMGVALDASDPLRPMEETRTLLIPREELSYGWGCLSGPPDGYFLVSVEGARVSVQFRSGSRVLRAFGWQEPGKIADSVVPQPRPVVAVTEEELRRAVSAALVLTPWAEARAEIGVLLNGERVGVARLEPVPHWAAFASETRVAIPPEKLKSLRLVNEVAFENPEKALFGVGNVRLEVRLAGGATARTAVCDRFLFSAEKAEAQARHQPTLGWEIIPAGVQTAVRLGQPLGPATLSFQAR